MLCLPAPKPMLALPLLTDVETVNVTEDKTVNVTALVHEAVSLHADIERVGRKTTKLAWRVGRLLMDIRAARKLEGKGKWEDSFKCWDWDDETQHIGDLSSMSIETARRYIRLAKAYRTEQELPDVPLCEAYRRAGILTDGQSAVERAASEVIRIADRLERCGEQIKKLRNGYEDALSDIPSDIDDERDREKWERAQIEYESSMRYLHNCLYGGHYRNRDGQHEFVGVGLPDDGMPQW